ncbi:MAG: MoxR family ATPase [Xanthomonadales bacterium]|nr:MoxR family ATPase [Xanthomonadales bacterium]
MTQHASTTAQPNKNSDAQIINKVIETIGHKILDKSEAIEIVVATLIAGGHVLLEDLPGLGKTTLAMSIAQVFGMDYKRIQLTSDMMPSDVLGVSIYDPTSQTFSYHKGPVFTQFLLADELNRATPKTQSALLEAMAENQVSMDGKTYLLDDAFFVMATQNPIDEAGTYNLPQSQLDRFLVSLSLGYPATDSERQLYSQSYMQAFKKPLPALTTPKQLRNWQQYSQTIHAAEEVLDFLQLLIKKTRTHSEILHGLSPRAGLSLFRLSQSLAMLAGRDFMTPADVKKAFYPVCRHRLVAKDNRPAKDIIKSIVHDTEII